MRGKALLENLTVRTAAIVVVAIVLNVLGNNLASQFSLPVWLDAFGTVLAAYALGPACGAIVAAATNIILSFSSLSSIVFIPAGVFIGWYVGYRAREGAFETFFGAMTTAGVVALGCCAISTVLNLIFFEGATGSVWGNGVRDFLMENGFPVLPASIIGQLYIEFLDKCVVVVGLFLFIKLIRWIRTRKALPEETATLAVTIIAIGLSITVAGGLALSPVSAFAAQSKSDEIPSYVQTVYSSENGLACGHANAVAQTQDGILWIGTYAGLYRYNGSKFQLMSNLGAVKNTNCLYVDEEGRLWVGTNDSGVAICVNEEITNVLTAKDGLPSDSVRCFAQSTNGNYYVGTSDGVAEVSLSRGLSVVSTIEGLGYTDSLAADQDGHVAAVTADGELFIIRDHEVLYQVKPEGEKLKYACVTFDIDGRLMAGTGDGRVLTYTVDDKAATLQSELVCNGMTNINCIKRMDDGSTWIMSDSGIGVVYGDGVFRLQETGAFKDSVEDAVADYQGNLWFASSRLGLLRLTRSSLKDVYADAGIEEAVVNTTAIWNGLLYAGNDDGLRAVDVDGRTGVETDLVRDLKGVRVRCLTVDSAGALWICTYGKGLMRVDSSGDVKTFDSGANDLGTRVRVCTELSDGSMAVGGDAGLSFVKNGEVVGTIPYGDEFGTAKILSLCELEDGKTLLAGTDGNGIVVVGNDKIVGHITRDDGLTSGVILRMVRDLDGQGVFIVTSNSICYRDANGVRELTNYPYSNNYDIVLDEDGEMFVLGSSGIYVVNHDQLLSGEPVSYSILDARMGLMGALTANSWNAIDAEKNLYLSTDRGVYRVGLDSYQPGRLPYRLMISSVRADNGMLKIDYADGISIDRGVKTIVFYPEVANYSLEDPLVSFYLEGMDEDWIRIRQSELTEIVYTNLPSGNYTLHLAISDEASNEIRAERTYSVMKETSIYDNWWFMLYMVVVGGAFVGWVSWFITRKRMERTLELQQAKLSLALQQVQMGNETIMAIANAVDAKDSRTSMHSHRVSNYAVMIAREYGFSEEEQENLRKAALLHDIGKIGIPDAVLNKPGRLTDEEYAIMKSHVTRGAEILKDFTLIDNAADGARYHHERYDGKGYPDGLKGEEIPLYGRIIAVADTFDAMTANRVYREAQDFDYVMNELHRGRGTQFDPVFVDIFIGLIDSGAIDMMALYKDGGLDADIDDGASKALASKALAEEAKKADAENAEAIDAETPGAEEPKAEKPQAAEPQAEKVDAESSPSRSGDGKGGQDE